MKLKYKYNLINKYNLDRTVNENGAQLSLELFNQAINKLGE